MRISDWSSDVCSSDLLVDGRWNLGQAEAKLGIELSDEATKQLLACTGQIVCETPAVHNEEEDRLGVKVTATAVSVLKPDLLVTVRHRWEERRVGKEGVRTCRCGWCT